MPLFALNSFIHGNGDQTWYALRVRIKQQLKDKLISHLSEEHEGMMHLEEAD